MNLTAMDVARAAGLDPSAQGDVPASAAQNGADGLADRDAFLKLLIAQIKNQDPLNPADGMEFLSQLAQFSELEQLISIRNEIQALRPNAAAEPGSPDTTAA
jgi:flagellar basal-body rod modification protein FlgD